MHIRDLKPAPELVDFRRVAMPFYMLSMPVAATIIGYLCYCISLNIEISAGVLILLSALLVLTFAAPSIYWPGYKLIHRRQWKEYRVYLRLLGEDNLRNLLIHYPRELPITVATEIEWVLNSFYSGWSSKVL